MLTRQQFETLYYCMKSTKPSQRDIASATHYSLGTINSTLQELYKGGYLHADNAISSTGMKALQPYKVDNAIIMAAGLSTRFAPISYEKPKGVLTVKGEVLVERQIRQLQEAGIENIIVVVGYMKEHFFYLSDEFGVEIVVNPEYATRNNNSTIMCIADRLGNSYICSSDDYFVENPFEQYVYDSYYAAVFVGGETDEYCLATQGKDKRIVGVEVGGENAWIMLGHAYWSTTYSKEFIRILRNIYNHSSTADMLWEDVYRSHIDQLPAMYLHQYNPGVIWEFDSLAELQEFDNEFINNVDSRIIDNICSVLQCQRSTIGNIVPIKQGLTNLSFQFSVDEQSYVYRHPGAGTDAIINRASEAASQAIGRNLGLDHTFIYEDPKEGWKISRYIEGGTELDYHNWDQVGRAIAMAHTLHNCGIDTGFAYDMHAATKKTTQTLGAVQRTAFKDFDSLYKRIDTLNTLALKYGSRTCLCHNDFYAPNFLVHEGGIELIDWEYSGMSDYASDLGVFICCSEDYTYEDAQRVLELYFQREPTEEELFHCVAYIAVISFYWFVWALYKDECGDPVGEWLYLWYKGAKTYASIAEDLVRKQGIQLDN